MGEVALRMNQAVLYQPTTQISKTNYRPPDSTTGKLTLVIINRLVRDNNNERMGSWDQAPRVVPEVLYLQKAVKFNVFDQVSLPGIYVIWI